ncbi:MAG: hypothetical protein WD403_09615, partial [Pirellulales bacterium]
MPLRPAASRERFQKYRQDLQRRRSQAEPHAEPGTNGQPVTPRPPHRSFWRLLVEFWKLLGGHRG